MNVRPFPQTVPVSARGFTLIEMMIALALVGLLMAGLMTFLFSMGDLWGRGGGQRLFYQHARNVTRYVQELVSAAAMPRATVASPAAPLPAGGESPPAAGAPGDESSRTAGGSAAAAAWRLAMVETPLPGSGKAPLLNLDLPAGARVLNWPVRPLPEVVASLAVREREGLVLFWASRLEVEFEEVRRETLLSPLVKAISYDYYEPEAKRWRSSKEPVRGEDGAYVRPDRLRLFFSHDGLELETTVVVPAETASVPAY